MTEYPKKRTSETHRKYGAITTGVFYLNLNNNGEVNLNHNYEDNSQTILKVTSVNKDQKETTLQT